MYCTTKGLSLSIQAITQDETDASYISLTNHQTYYFRHLIGADGGKHETSNHVSQGFGQPIHDIDCPIQERHPFHASVQLSVNAVSKSAQQTPQAPFNHQALGWDRPLEPQDYLIFNGKNKFSFAGEIPQHIYEASKTEQRELLKQWVGIKIQQEYGIDPMRLEYKQNQLHDKNKLRAAIFKLSLSKTDSPLLTLSQGFYAPIGDARRTPNYLMGHGLNDAIQTGITFIDCIKKDLFF